MTDKFIMEIAAKVEDVAHKLLKTNHEQASFKCPICHTQAIVRRDHCCGVEAFCFTPDCLFMHINMGLNRGLHEHGKTRAFSIQTPLWIPQ